MKYYAHYGHKDFILCPGHKGGAIKKFFLDYNEALSNDFVLSHGGQNVQLLNTDFSNWTITFSDTGSKSLIGERSHHTNNRQQNAAILIGYYDKEYDMIWIGTVDGPRKLFLNNWAEQYYVYPNLRDYGIKRFSFFNNNEFLLESENKFLRVNKDGKIQMEMPRYNITYGNWSRVNNNVVQIDYVSGNYLQKRFVPDSILSRQTNFKMCLPLSDAERIYLGNDFVYYNVSKNIVNVIPGEQLPSGDFNFSWSFKLNTDSVMLLSINKAYIYSIYRNKIYTHKIFPFNIYSNVFINDTVWILSDHDFVRYTLKNDNIKHYALSNISFYISQIDADKHHNLWISDFQNICYFDVKKEVSQLYKVGDMLKTYSLSFDQDKDRFLLSGENNVLICNPDSFIHSLKSTKLHFTRLFVNNIDYSPVNFKNLQKDIFYLQNIILKPDQSTFSIEYSALKYTFPESVISEYMLEGVDASWCKVKDGSNLATYKKIRNGSYVFRLRKESNPGSEIQLHITVLPFWWQTWWFRIGVSFILIICFVFIYSYRTRQIRKQNIKLEKTVKDRTKEIEEKNKKLEEQSIEIKGQAEILLQVNQDLNEQKEEIQSINEELRAQSEELYTTNEELKKLNATKDKFFSIIAHDLKNPFHAISGSAEFMEMEYLSMDDATRMEFIKVIKNSSKNASTLLENLLQWARSQTNSISYNPEYFDINIIAYETMQLLRTNADNKKIHLKNNVKSNAFVFADRNMITTVLRNLINNAIKFTPAEGTISVFTNLVADIMELIVSDTGVGMDETTKNKLFRIDQHVTNQGTSGEAGTGLGLIICKEFIDKNNGAIRVESEIGKGSGFIISLPAAHSVEIKTEKITEQVIMKEKMISIPEKEINLSPKDKNSPLLLIVEDNEEIRRNIINSIDKHFNISEAVNGKEGLDKAFSDMPDLIISDWMMPEMEGIELCATLKKDERTSHIPDHSF